MRYNVPKGLYDIVPQETKDEDCWRLSHRWHYLETQIRDICYDFGYQEIRTPIFENSALFIRGIGESSDIVSKEMYTFEDKASRSMTLRPEGTAPVMRAFVEKGLNQLGSYHKFFYIGPYFRYDRPQAGRYRQFHQFGIEAIGSASSAQDAELMAMLAELYTRLGIKDWALLLNTVGDSATRSAYKKALRAYLQPHFDQLSKESQVRFDKNPLRILDTKDLKDQKILQDAPSIHQFLSKKSQQHFDQVQSLLKELNIPFTIAPNLVRGLDYYNQTVFEITTPNLGAQNSIGAGGRFDGLIAELGGAELPSTGFAVGLERLLITMDRQHCHFPPPPTPFVYIVPVGPIDTLSYAMRLRHARIPTDIAPTQTARKGLQQANCRGAVYALVLGEDEIRSQKARLKKLSSRDEIAVDLSRLVETCRKLYE